VLAEKDDDDDRTSSILVSTKTNAKHRLARHCTLKIAIAYKMKMFHSASKASSISPVPPPIRVYSQQQSVTKISQQSPPWCKATRKSNLESAVLGSQKWTRM
jgi:hypothetical protein